MRRLKLKYYIICFIWILAVLWLLPKVTAFADTTVNTSTNGTIEVQAMVQEGFIEPITVELSGKDNYIAKLLVTADNHYVLRKQLPNGIYTVTFIYTNTTAETDSQIWASTETLEIEEGKTTVLNVAVLDDSSGDVDILFGEENNPFIMNIENNPDDFMKENAAKLEEQDNNQQVSEESEQVVDKESDKVINQNEITEGQNIHSTDKSPEIDAEHQKHETQSAWDKLIDLIVRLARYILLSAVIMVCISVIVWVYRRFKYGE